MQWVCSLPWRLRYAMGYDAKLCSAVLAEFVRALRCSLRRRAKRTLGLHSVEDAQFGALTIVQRGDSSLRLNVHFHCLVLDAVYVRDADRRLCFHTLPRPTPEELIEIARQLLGASPGAQTRKLVYPVRELRSSGGLGGSWPGERARRLGHRQ